MVIEGEILGEATIDLLLLAFWSVDLEYTTIIVGNVIHFLLSSVLPITSQFGGSTHDNRCVILSGF